MKTIKLFEMFAGYGGASFGLSKANIPFDCVGYSEIDLDAIKLYELNHPEVRCYGDCNNIQIKNLPDFDLLTAGFPCQSFSMAGNRQGFVDSRGNLFYDIIRIAKYKKPKYMLLENVEGLINHDEGKTINIILREIRLLGYGLVYKVLNSKDYGTPQNRKRIWIVCKLGGWEFMEFMFPEKIVLKRKWKDFIDEPKNFVKVNKTPSRDDMREECKNITNENTCQTITLKQDRYPNAGIVDYEDYYRFLTPKECFRLMGFFEDEIKINDLTISKGYKLAGNGWDVNLVSKIFKNIFNK